MAEPEPVLRVELDFTGQALTALEIVSQHDLPNDGLSRALRAFRSQGGVLRALAHGRVPDAISAVVGRALGAYRMLVEEEAAGSKVLVKRRDGQLFEMKFEK